VSPLVLWDADAQVWNDLGEVPALLPPTITTPDLHPFLQGYAPLQFLTGTGSPTWSVVGGALPAGVVLDSSGAMTGATSAGDTSGTVTVRATNFLGHTDQTFAWTTFAVLAAKPGPTNTGNQGGTGGYETIDAYTVTTPGTVIANKIINGQMTIAAANCIIRDCVINSGYWAAETKVDADDFLIEDCTIITGLNCGLMIAGGSRNVVVRRCDISQAVDGMKVSGVGLRVFDNYIHDLVYDPETDTHNDAIQGYSFSETQVVHNSLATPDTGCISLFDGQGNRWSNVLIQDNWLVGGIFPAYLGGPDIWGLQFLDNTISEWGEYPFTSFTADPPRPPGEPGNVMSGNHEPDGTPIP
jgi:hypothetical protein